MANEKDLAAGAAELEKLADELDGQTYVCTLVTGGGRRPCLQVTDRAAVHRAENIHSDGTHFYWVGRTHRPHWRPGQRRRRDQRRASASRREPVTAAGGDL